VNGTQLAAVLDTACARLASTGDELRELDAEVGDGDLGITVTKSAAAVRTRMAALGADVSSTDVVLVAGEAFGTANPSTFASLVSSGVKAGAKATDLTEVSTAEVVAFGRVVAETIARRGKSAVGDKTILDALVPSLDAAEANSEGAALEAAITAATAAIAETAAIAAKKGRAAWAGDRGIGVPDAGATAYLRFLEALR